jgi:hypothetical protein
MASVSKNSAVELLFKQGIEQKEISKLLHISETTISKIVVNKQLRRKRLDHDLRKNTAEEDALTALAHQSRIIRMISQKLGDGLPENLDDISMDELKAALIPKGEIDALQKLFTTIKGKELDWSAIVRILREFSNWLKDEDLEAAKEIVPHIDTYINIKRKSLQ